MKQTLFALVLLAVCALPAAHAVPITVSFTVSGLIESGIVGIPISPPTDPVTGSIVYDSASVTSNINSLISVDLTTDGHAYGVGELGFISGQIQVIGGLVNFANIIAPFTDDFFLAWDQITLQPFSFGYSSSRFSSMWATFDPGSFSEFSVTQASVSEPATLALLGLSLLGVCVARRRGR